MKQPEDIFRFPYEHLVPEIAAHARAEAPRECCGIITLDGHYLKSKNLAAKPEISFEIDPEIFVKADAAGIACIVHSHTNGNPDFSLADISQIRAWEYPWFLFDVTRGVTRYVDPKIRRPYLGRPFVYGFYDCWNLSRDWYQFEMNIKFPWLDYGEPGEWSSPHWNKMLENVEKLGFYRLPEGEKLRRGDALLMAVRHPTPNHIGIIDKPESNCFIHHTYGGLSCKSIYGGWYREITHSVWRHGTC